jgi:putative peptidoglycan lipid II flippase
MTQTAVGIQEADSRPTDLAGEGTAAATGDSIRVAAWTVISRITGVLKIAAIGAVLGATFFGNTYQFTNSLPNLVYYGFLAGSLFSSLLVPALVHHMDAGDTSDSGRVAGGFLGLTLLALVALVPVAILLGPLSLRLASLGGGQHLVGVEQERIGRLLILMFAPQVFCYAVVGTSSAIMNARGRFALAAAAPAIENIGTLVVLGATAVIYGTGTPLGSVPTGEMLLLGLGTTAAVAAHAATQWWGARRVGVVLVPRWGWRDSEVRKIVRRALPSVAQAGLVALQVLALMAVANRVSGGVVAFQVALNFFYLAIALGATPVALSLLPRLSRLHEDGDGTEFRATLARGLSLGFFVAIPAAVGYLVLARPIAEAISFGRMDSHAGVAILAAAVAGLALAVIGQTAFLIATYASYARKDTRSPLTSMMIQAALCVTLLSISFAVHGYAALLVLGLAYSLSIVVAACHLTARVCKGFGRSSDFVILSHSKKVVAGAALMAGPAWLVATRIGKWLGPPLGPRAGILAGAIVGALVFLGLQAWWRTPELGLLADGFRHLRSRGGAAAGLPAAGTTSGPQSAPVPTSTDGPDPGVLALPPADAVDDAQLGVGYSWRTPSARWLLVPAMLCAAVVVGDLIARSPLLALGGCLVALLLACIWARPQVGGYLIVALTPVLAGIDRGKALPTLRPSEVLQLLVGLALLGRGLSRLRTGRFPTVRVSQVEIGIALMAVASSILPLLWMLVRQAPITKDDLLYALIMWKYLGLYAIVRTCIRTERQVYRCLWLLLGTGCVVATLAILQSLGLFGIPRILSKYYAPFGYTNAFQARGSSTLGIPAATADYLMFCLAIAISLWILIGRHRLLLGVVAGLCAMGTLSAAEFSSAIALLVCAVCIAAVTSSPRLLAYMVPFAAVAGWVLRPVIQRRLNGFHSLSGGVPTSWAGRLNNLRTYFWPKLFSHWNFLLGVRPSARVVVPYQATGYVWIESGYTWLLWGGGIPFLGSFLYFFYWTVKMGWRVAHQSIGAVRVAGCAVFVAIIVVTVGMIFDMHLTYRGSADTFFALLALAGVPAGLRAASSRHQTDRLSSWRFN